MDKKTTPSFSSSSVKPVVQYPVNVRSLPRKLWIFFVVWPAITGLYLSFRKACRG